MEDTLRVRAYGEMMKLVSLNPCFNGRYSQSKNNKLKRTITLS